MSRSRFTGRYMGAGGRIMRQMVDQRRIHAELPAALRNEITERCGCTDADITKAIQEGITDFGDAFEALMKRQYAILTPPPENDDESETT